MILSFIIFAAALFIDGATDCANSVTGAVSARVITVRGATTLSAVFSFIGCAVFCLFWPSVAESSASAVEFPREYSHAGVIASLLAVALFSGVAWVMGLPTSEGHALISASAGAALCLGGRVDYQHLALILFSVVPAALICAVFAVMAARILKKSSDASFRTPIIIFCALSSLFHGAQDGQKFLGLAFSASLLSEKARLFAVLCAAAFMAIGTLFGGRIIRKMGNEMVQADRTCALSSDVGSAASLALLTALGIPASTTHQKMISLAAVTRSLGGRTDRSTFILLCGAWLATFPISFGLGFFISKGFLTFLL